MNILLPGLIAYLVYIPVIFSLIFLAIRKHQRYSPSKNMLSFLAETKSPAFELASGAISLFGLLSLLFTINLGYFLPLTAFSAIGLSFLYLRSFSAYFVVIFPQDKYRQIHGVFGTLVTVGVLGSLIFLIRPIISSNAFPDGIIMINLTIIGLVLFLLSSDYLHRIKLDSFILKYRTFWQWSMLASVIAWDYLMAIFILLSQP